MGESGRDLHSVAGKVGGSHARDRRLVQVPHCKQALVSNFRDSQRWSKGHVSDGASGATGVAHVAVECSIVAPANACRHCQMDCSGRRHKFPGMGNLQYSGSRQVDVLDDAGPGGNLNQGMMYGNHFSVRNFSNGVVERVIVDMVRGETNRISDQEGGRDARYNVSKFHL